MSKKYGIMDDHFQVYNLNIHLKANNVAPDTIDIFSLMDRTLHLPENINNLDNILGIGNKYNYV